MPSYAIHLAVAEEYLKKSNCSKENHEKFIKGVIYPDMVKDKSLSHYGSNSSVSDLSKFLSRNRVNGSFKRGCFLHLMTDYLFYNKYIDTWSKSIYNDYDILNNELIEKYKLEIPENAKVSILPTENKKLTILSENLVDKFISDVSDFDIDKVAKEIEENPEKWTTFRPLKIV